MASTAQFIEDNGTAISTATGGNRGTTRTTGVTNMNWKNTDDTATVYSTSPITAGSNSYEKFQAVVFTGAFNQVSNGKWQHVSGVLQGGLTIKGLVSGSGIYTTPSTTTNASLIRDQTVTGSITTGYAVLFGGRGPEATGKFSSTTLNPAFSEYLVTQLQTTVAAAPGDTDIVTFAFVFDEN